MMKRYPTILIFCVLCVSVIVQTTCNVVADGDSEEHGFVVKKKNMKTLVSTENGEILAARVGDGNGNAYLLHFFTMDPNSLFLPVILHSDMVFYVSTGSGKLSWTEENELKTTDLRRGDVYRLKEGAVFFIQSNLETETERRRLRINAIFSSSNIHHLHVPTATATRPYSSIRDMVLGFDKKVLQSAFKVGEEEIEELLNGGNPPAIIHGVSKSGRRAWEMETKFIGRLLGSGSINYNIFELNKKKGKGSAKLFNLFKEGKDFENRNGWSTAVTGEKLSALKDTNVGLFMVNLTTGSMMGPHWNPVATEIGVVLQGRGMVHVACSCSNETAGCRSMRFEVEEGDVFVVPRFHPMAQMAFNNGTFVFMGFSGSARKNHPQYLAGQASVLRTLSKDVLAIAFNVRNSTMDQLLGSQQDSVILGCTSCAEEELRILQEERKKEKEKAREEEERRRKKEEEEEEAREREEEEAKRHEEEEAAAKKQEEERKKREEEEEEEAKRKKEEEEAAKRKEEERKRQEEKEAAREREEEEAEKQEQERKRREKEEAAAAKKKEEEEEARREEEERERREEAAERKKAEEERRRRQEEKEARREEEERQRREEEEEGRERARERKEEKGGRSEEEEAEEEEWRREKEWEREEEEERRQRRQEGE